MVFFNCNSCSEAFKGNKVEGHKFKCNFSSLTCVDCLKDFDIITFKSHKTCMTEDQKYGGKNYVQKVMKGQKKQENWLNKLQSLISSSKFSKDIENYLNRISNYDNIPRKKPKFINFVKSSIVKDERVAEKLWTIIEQALKPLVQNDKLDEKHMNGTKQNGQTNDKKNDETTDEFVIKKQISINQNAVPNNREIDLKRKLQDNCDLENKKMKVDDLKSSADEPLKQVVERLIERSKSSATLINPTKLTKKVLKRQDNGEMKLKKFKKLIRRLGPYTEFKDLPTNEFIAKLNKKDCFVIDKEMITYKVNY